MIISQYHIFANSSTTALVVINSTQSTGTVTYNVTGLSPSTSYYFRIFARDIDGNFSAQDSLCNTINTAAPAGPATPTGLYANTFSDTNIYRVECNSRSNGYVLYRSTRANGIYDVVIDTTSINYMDNFNTGYYILLPSTGLFWS
jgi:chitodextrinase